MAIIDAIGFDDADAVLAITDGGSHSIDTTSPRTGARCLRLNSSGIGAQSSAQYTIATLATAFVYFAFNATILTNSGFLDFLDNTTVHLRLNVRADGHFEVFRGAGTTSLQIGTFVYTASAYTQCAIKYSIADAGGTFELRLNGSTTPDITFTGDTRNAANAQVTNYIWRSPSGNSASLRLDDLVFQDTTGSAPENDWLGDVGCEYAFPNGVASNNWTVTGAADAAAATSEVPADDGTSTIDSATVGQKALLDYDNLVVTSGTIYAAVHVIRAIKSAAGPREIRSTNKLAGTEVNGSSQALATGWARYRQVYHRDPSGSAWTGANFNSAQWSTEVTV